MQQESSNKIALSAALGQNRWFVMKELLFVKSRAEKMVGQTSSREVSFGRLAYIDSVQLR